jgi:hypothetical protein
MPACELAPPGMPETQATGASKRLVVTWQHPNERGIQPIGFLSYDARTYRFAYIRNVLNVRDFRALLGFEELDRVYESAELFPLFAQRVMAPRRPDYQRYVKQLGLHGEPDPWEQITRSQGHRHGDSLQLLPEPTVQGEELTGRFLAHGIRHVPEESHKLYGQEVRVTAAEVEAALNELRLGDSLILVPEPDNPINNKALMLTTRSMTPVGWVPDLLLDDLHRLQQAAHVRVQADHINPERCAVAPQVASAAKGITSRRFSLFHRRTVGAAGCVTRSVGEDVWVTTKFKFDSSGQKAAAFVVERF